MIDHHKCPTQAVPVYQPYHIYHPYQETLNYERRNLITEISGYLKPSPLTLLTASYGMNYSQPHLVVRL